MARPPKPIDWDIVISKMEAGCSASEIYNDLDIDDNTFYSRFKQEFNQSFQDYSCKKRSVGIGNIRHQQYIKAMDGNTQLLIVLGREWLGQEKEQKQRSQVDEDRLNALLDQLQSLRSASNQATNNNNTEDKS